MAPRCIGRARSSGNDEKLRPYKNSPTKHEVWERFQGYTKLIVLGGGGAKGGPATKPAA